MSESFNHSPEKGIDLQPIPDFTELREKKKGYRDIPIDTSDERYNEPLRSLSDFGVAGQAYYSRSNTMFDEPLPGVSKELRVRQSIGETLASLNKKMQQPFVTELFGGEVELFVQDGVRSFETQRYLHAIAFPEKIQALHPDWTAERVLEERDKFIAFPTLDPEHPSPHAASAVDLWVRFKQPTSDYVSEDDFVPMGYEDAEISERCYPDYYEANPPTTPEEKEYQKKSSAFLRYHDGSVIRRGY